VRFLSSKTGTNTILFECIVDCVNFCLANNRWNTVVKLNSKLLVRM
jgi:hypothetical protein